MELTELRAQIDGIDRELIALLERRMDVAVEIAAWKAAAGVPILDTPREEAKLNAVRVQCRPETAEGIMDIFRAVMSASRARQAVWTEARHGK